MCRLEDLEVEDGTNVVTSFCDSARELVMILKSGKAMAIANLSKITEAEAAAYVFAACNFERTQLPVSAKVHHFFSHRRSPLEVTMETCLYFRAAMSKMCMVLQTTTA